MIKIKNSFNTNIDWLGNVPEHWDFLELRRKWQVTDCKHVTPEYVDSGLPVVSTTEVKPGKLTLDGLRETSYVNFLFMTEGNRKPKRGDLIYSRNASVGSAAYEVSRLPAVGLPKIVHGPWDNNHAHLRRRIEAPVGCLPQPLRAK